MTYRDTGTGGVLEAMILPALERGGYAYRKQVKVGLRHGGGTHKVDAVATKVVKPIQSGIEVPPLLGMVAPSASDRDGDVHTDTILVSLKWQQTGGTAEQKVPFEVMCLAQAIMDGHANKAYLVLGGDGWTLRDYYVSGKLAKHLIHADLVKVVTLEAFIRMANRGEL
jgi:hypothetical protein